MTREEKDKLLDIYNRLGSIATSLKQEPCEDAISRQAVLDAFWKLNVELRPNSINAILNMVNDMPPVNPQESKTGHWIEVIDEIDSLGNKTWHHKCSMCGNEDSGWGNYKFCPNCGAKMEESRGKE